MLSGKAPSWLHYASERKLVNIKKKKKEESGEYVDVTGQAPCCEKRS